MMEFLKKYFLMSAWKVFFKFKLCKTYLYIKYNYKKTWMD